MLRPIKNYISASSVDINKEDLYRCIDGKSINRVCTTILFGVGKITPRTSFTHPLALPVHTRSEVSLEDPVISAVHINVPANGIGMEVHEDYVG